MLGPWQRYTARVTSTLPVLMSAIRTAPSLESFPSANDLGKKLVTYEYNQVRARWHERPESDVIYILARTDPFVPPRHRLWKRGISRVPGTRGKDVDERCVGGTGTRGCGVVRVQRRHAQVSHVRCPIEG